MSTTTTTQTQPIPPVNVTKGPLVAQLKTNTPLDEQMKEAARQRLQANTEAAGTLRTGEFAENIVNPVVIAAGNTKTYYHQHAGASFFMPDGLQVRFLGGQFTTDDADIIRELDKIVNKPTSLVTSQPVSGSSRVLSPEMAARAIEAQGTVASLPGAAPLRSDN